MDQRKQIWATVAIIVVWAAVALASIYSPALEVVDQGGDTTVRLPMAAFFVSMAAAIATPFIAIWGYRGR